MKDNDIECVHCGEIFPMNLNRCPNCGVSLYEPDDEIELPASDPVFSSLSLPKNLRLGMALFLGWLTSGMLAFMIYVIAKSILENGTNTPTSGLIVTLLSTSIGAFAGGFAAFRIALQKPLFYTLFVGLFTMGIAILLYSNELHNALTFIFPRDPLLWLPLLLVTYAGVFTARKIMRDYVESYIFQKPVKESDLYLNLLTRVQGDHETVERLIEYERKRLPHADRVAWLRNAIERWELDNR